MGKLASRTAEMRAPTTHRVAHAAECIREGTAPRMPHTIGYKGIGFTADFEIGLTAAKDACDGAS